MKLFATTDFSFEKILKNECLLLGCEVDRSEPGFVIFDGDIVEANLSLRTAERVFVVLGESDVRSFDELFSFVSELPLEEMLPKNARVTVDAKSHKSELFSLRDIQKITKKAVARRFEKAYQVNLMPEDGEDYHLLLRLEKDHAYLLLDTSGDPLHKRGYRISGKVAPIRENLAAALVLSSRFFGKGYFADPMCGSGTIVIEAAMIARNIAPGLKRSFRFERWGISSEEMREKLMSQIKAPQKGQFFASDINPAAVRLAKNNAKNSLVSDIQFEVRDLKDFVSPGEGGTLVTNAPYGERMGDEVSLQEMEKALAEKILPLESWTLGLLLGSEDFSYRYKSRKARVRVVHNGKIKTWFYQYEPTKRW